MTPNRITVFTKPWKDPTIRELVAHVKSLGFDGVELAVRPGYQVTPENASTELAEAAKIFREEGLTIESIASDMSADMIKACDKAGVPVLRTMLRIDPDLGYRASVRKWQEDCLRLDSVLLDTDVQIGVQNHCGDFVGSSVGLMEAIAPLSDSFVAVLDLAHTSLCGEPEPYALEIATPRLAMVNLKNAVRLDSGKNANGETIWKHSWVGAKDGFTSWPMAVDLMKKIHFSGPICITAEYRGDDGKPLSGASVDPLVSDDLAYLKLLQQNL